MLIKILTFCLTALVAGGTSLANEDARSEDPHIIVSGDSNLGRRVISELSGLRARPNLSEDEIRKRLIDTNLFEEVNVIRTGDLVLLRLEQKTTWFVLPYFARDEGRTVFALTAGKTALLGEDLRAVVAYQIGDRKGAIQLHDEAVVGTPLLLEGSLSFEDTRWKLFEGRQIAGRTVNQMRGGSIGAGYRLGPNWKVLAMNYVETHRFEELNGSTKSGLQVSHKLLLEFDRFYQNEGISDGLSAVSYFEPASPMSDFQFWKAGEIIKYSVFLKPPFNWVTSARFEYGNTLPRYQLFGVGGSILRGFPSDLFRANSYLSLQNEFLIGSVDLSKVRFRPFTFVDWGWVQGAGRTAVGLGLRMFLKTVTIPALEINTGYGLNPNGVSIAVAIGGNF